MLTLLRSAVSAPEVTEKMYVLFPAAVKNSCVIPFRNAWISRFKFLLHEHKPSNRYSYARISHAVGQIWLPGII